MGEAKNKAAAIVFALSGDRKTLILGVPRPAWDYMAGGKSHNFNLRPIGFPVNIMVFGGETRAHIYDVLNAAMAGEARLEDFEADHAIPEDERARPRMRQAALRYLRRTWFPGGHDFSPSDEWLDGLCDAILKQEVDDEARTS